VVAYQTSLRIQVRQEPVAEAKGVNDIVECVANTNEAIKMHRA
jgi:hypothetical protein